MAQTKIASFAGALLLTKRDAHQNDSDQYHHFLVLLGALNLSRLFYLMVAGRLLGFSCGPPCDKVVEKSWRVPGVPLV